MVPHPLLHRPCGHSTHLSVRAESVAQLVHGDVVEAGAFLPPGTSGDRALAAAARTYGKIEGNEVRIDLKLSQEEWGELAGATREAVNKQLRVWTDQGLVRRERGYVVLCQPEEIARLARCVPL